MRSLVQKWGNSLAVRIPKPFAVDLGLAENAAVEISVAEGRLVVVPHREEQLRLADLLSGITEANLPGAWKTGPAVGKEGSRVNTPHDYLPARGDLVWVTLDPQAGHEQRGKQPALILSPAAYNGRVGQALLCPIINQAKGYPFEVPLPAGLAVTGVVLADQIKSLDWKARRCTRADTVGAEVVTQVLRRLHILLGEESGR